MMVYRRRERHPFKWVVAIIIFMLVLGVTFNEVYGLNLQPIVQQQDGSGSSLPPAQSKSTPTLGTNFQDYGGCSSGSNEAPPCSSVPEPSVLILFSTGLITLYLLQRRKPAAR
jgi:hypothetical protein